MELGQPSRKLPLRNEALALILGVGLVLVLVTPRPTTVLAAVVFLCIPPQAYMRFWSEMNWRKFAAIALGATSILLAAFLAYGAPIELFWKDWLKIIGLAILIMIGYQLGRRIRLTGEQEAIILWSSLAGFALIAWLMCFRIYYLDPNSPQWWPEPWERNRAAVLFSLAAGAGYVHISLSLFRNFRVDFRLLWLGGFLLTTWWLWLGTASETAKLVLVGAMIYPLFATLLRYNFKYLPALVFAGATFISVLAVEQAYQAYIPFEDPSHIGSVGARLEIWLAVARFCLANNFAAFGFDATQYTLALADMVQGRYWTGEFSHPHNFGLQVLLDLGWPGVLLAIALLFGVGAVAKGCPPTVQFLILGVIGASFVSHGAWQSWWWLAIALVGLFAGYMDPQAGATATPWKGDSEGSQ
jgi:hypothetical protein